MTQTIAVCDIGNSTSSVDDLTNDINYFLEGVIECFDGSFVLFNSKEISLNTTLRVLNLAISVDASLLEDMFSVVGDVRSARVVKGIGFVEMSNVEQMQNCVHYFNGLVKNGLTLMVQEDRPVPVRPISLKKPKRPLRTITLREPT